MFVLATVKSIQWKHLFIYLFIYSFIHLFIYLTAESLSSSSFGYQAASYVQKKPLNRSFIQARWFKSVRHLMWSHFWSQTCQDLGFKGAVRKHVTRPEPVTLLLWSPYRPPTFSHSKVIHTLFILTDLFEYFNNLHLHEQSSFLEKSGHVLVTSTYTGQWFRFIELELQAQLPPVYRQWGK